MNHAKNEALLLGLVPASRFEHEIRSWDAGIALSYNRVLPFRWIGHSIQGLNKRYIVVPWSRLGIATNSFGAIGESSRG